MEKKEGGGKENTFFPTKTQYWFYTHRYRGFLPLTSVKIGLEPWELHIPASLEVSSKSFTTFTEGLV